MIDLEPLTSQTTFFFLPSYLLSNNLLYYYSNLFIKMSPLQDSPELPPTRASVRGRGTSRKQKQIPDKAVEASLGPADSDQALNHEHIQTEKTKKKNMV